MYKKNIDIREINNPIYKRILSTNEYPASCHRNHFNRLTRYNSYIRKCIRNDSDITLKSLLEMDIKPEKDSITYCDNPKIIIILVNTKYKSTFKYDKNILLKFKNHYETFESLVNNLK